MKKFFLTLSFLNILWAQFSDPAQFTVNIDDVNQGEVAIIDVNAELDFTWRIYAVYDVPEGPSSTKFIIESDIVNKSGCRLPGAVTEHAVPQTCRVTRRQSFLETKILR